LHADKQYFMPGESVFFAVHKTTPDTLPLRSCTVALVDEGGGVLETRRLLLTDEPASGHFILPSSDTIRNFSLQCRMDGANASPLTGLVLFSRLKPLPDPVVQNPPLLTWWPESGLQSAGWSSVYFFRISGLAASDMPLRYAVVTNGGDTLQQGTVTKDGAGRIELPYKNDGSIRLCYTAGAVLYRANIPAEAAGTGDAVLNLYPVPGAWVSRVRTGKAGSYTLQLSQENTIYYRGTAPLQAGDDFSKTFPQQQLRKGLNYLQLLDENARVLGERPVFRNMAEPLSVRSVRRVRPDKIRLQLAKEITGVFSV
jgi:hypothetical protein